MDNFFITKSPYTKSKTKKSLLQLLKLINKVFRKLKLGLVVNSIDTSVDMNTIEQRINYYHLLDRVIDKDVKGDVVELGCFTGQCALLFQKVIEQNGSDKKLHLFDSFDVNFTEKGIIEEVLIDNFKTANLNVPKLHKGYFHQTLPDQLPKEIAFAHIDCGQGGDKLAHKEVLLYCFGQLYPRLSTGAVCVLMDYNDPDIDTMSHEANPGVKLAYDEFFNDKPEEIVPLYGNQYFHAYFTKK